MVIPIGSEENRIITEIRGAIDGLKNILLFNLQSEAQQIENRVNNTSSNIIGNLLTQFGISNNLTQNVGNGISNNVSGQADSIRSNINNARFSIENVVNSGISGLNNFLQNVQMNVLSRVNQSIQTTEATTLQAQQNIISKIANAVLDIDASILGTSQSVQDQIKAQTAEILAPIEAISNQVGDDLQNSIQNVITALKSIFQPFIDWLLEQINKFLQWFNQLNADALQSLEDSTDDLINLGTHAQSNPDANFIPDFLREFSFGDQTNLLKTALGILLFIPNVLNISHAAYMPTLEHITQQVNVLNPTQILDAETAIRGIWRETVDFPFAVEQLAKAGYTREHIVTLLETYKQVLSVDQIRNLFLRGYINQNEVDFRLSTLGYGDEEITQVFRLFYVLPPIQDLIRFAVREVYTTEIVNLYRTDENFPSQFANEAAKQGLSEESAKQYWRAHWELPSITSGYEMFHRGIIDNNGLETLLRTQDVMPYWRDKLIQMSYSIPTRVDVRRLYNIGEYNRNQVKAVYKQLGYDDTVSEALTRFTEIEYAPDDPDSGDTLKSATRSAIEQSYVNGLITYDEAFSGLKALSYTDESIDLFLSLAEFKNRTDNYADLKKDFNQRIQSIVLKLYTRSTLSRLDAVSQLVDLGFVENEANALLDIADLEYTLTLQDDIVETVQIMYKDRTISNSDLLTVLSGFGYTNAEIQKITTGLDIFRELRTRKPTLAQFTNFLKDGVITFETWVNEVRGLGYADHYVDMYARQLGVEEGIS